MKSHWGHLQALQTVQILQYNKHKAREYNSRTCIPGCGSGGGGGDAEWGGGEGGGGGGRELEEQAPEDDGRDQEGPGTA